VTSPEPPRAEPPDDTAPPRGDGATGDVERQREQAWASGEWTPRRGPFAKAVAIIILVVTAAALGAGVVMAMLQI